MKVTRTRLPAAAMAAVFVVGLLASLAGIGVRSTDGGKAAVDEPQYLLTALSLYEDRSLDIDDELDDERWRAYHDTNLPMQTEVLPDGSQISPHDPLLPLVLAVPVGLGGLVAAKATMAVFAGLTAAAVLWVAVRRFAVGIPVAIAGVAVAFASPPLAVYGQQIYPEIPAALAVTVAVGALTGPLARGGLVTAVTVLVALPWLSVKYAPLTAILAATLLVLLLRGGRVRAALGVLAGLAAAGMVYLAVHQAIWGGWTVYASADHFRDSGEFGVVGFEPDYLGRSQRLAALLLDRSYGLMAWQPGWLLVLPALGALLAARPPRWGVPAAAVTVGWLVATFVALTMNGFWFPGRQVVVILPLLVLLVVWWLDRVPWPARLAAAALGLLGVVALVALLIDGHAGEINWVSRFQEVDAPIRDVLAGLLPDYRAPGDRGVWARHGPWLAMFALLAAAGWVGAHPPGRRATASVVAASAVLAAGGTLALAVGAGLADGADDGEAIHGIRSVTALIR